jgi:hypothetical protein
LRRAEGPACDYQMTGCDLCGDFLNNSLCSLLEFRVLTENPGP